MKSLLTKQAMFPAFILGIIWFGLLMPTAFVEAVQDKPWCYRYTDRDGRYVGEECFISESACNFARENESRGAPTAACSGGGSVIQDTPPEFIPLTDLPPEFYKTTDISGFFNAVFRYGIVVAGFLAVIMLVVAGFKYMTSDAVGSKSDAKDQIFSAITGLLLILLSAVLLAIINPDILKLNFLN